MHFNLTNLFLARKQIPETKGTKSGCKAVKPVAYSGGAVSWFVLKSLALVKFTNR
jgi:hypothetical protein